MRLQGARVRVRVREGRVAAGKGKARVGGVEVGPTLPSSKAHINIILTGRGNRDEAAKQVEETVELETEPDLCGALTDKCKVRVEVRGSSGDRDERGAREREGGEGRGEAERTTTPTIVHDSRIKRTPKKKQTVPRRRRGETKNWISRENPIKKKRPTMNTKLPIAKSPLSKKSRTPRPMNSAPKAARKVPIFLLSERSSMASAFRDGWQGFREHR